nr:MAG TPA: hypothetical protein [Caudoviricetes sp.]
MYYSLTTQIILAIVKFLAIMLFFVAACACISLAGYVISTTYSFWVWLFA